MTGKLNQPTCGFARAAKVWLFTIAPHFRSSGSLKVRPEPPHPVAVLHPAAPTNTQVQEFWSEQSKNTREQRQEQYAWKEEVERELQPIKAAYEASRDSLLTLHEEDVSTKTSAAWCSNNVNCLVDGQVNKTQFL